MYGVIYVVVCIVTYIIAYAFTREAKQEEVLVASLLWPFLWILMIIGAFFACIQWVAEKFREVVQN